MNLQKRTNKIKELSGNVAYISNENYRGLAQITGVKPQWVDVFACKFIDNASRKLRHTRQIICEFKDVKVIYYVDRGEKKQVSIEDYVLND